jgi:hypothetical protein
MSDLNIAPRDPNHVPSILFKGSDGLTYPVKGDEVTGRLYVDSAGGSGTVTSIAGSTGILLTPDPITTTGTVGLSTALAPMATLTGKALQFLRVNAGETAVEYAAVAGGGITIGTTTITSGTNTRILYNNAGVVGEYTLAGSGTVVAMATAPTFQTSINGAYLTASEILITDASKNIVSAAVATYPSLTELTYLKGVTSAIQTQLGTKQATITFGTGVQTALGVNIGSAGAPVLFNGALGTPSSGTLTNATGLPTAGLVDDAVTLAKMAPGTDGNLITYDSNGDPAYVATGTAGHVLTSNGAGAAPTFQAAGGGAFQTATISLSSAQILGMFVTPVQIVAGVAGQIVELIDVAGQFTNGGTQYADGGNIELREETSATILTGILFTTAEINGAAVVIKSTTSQITNKVRTSGKGIYISNASGAFTTGTGTLKIYVSYRMVKL